MMLKVLVMAMLFFLAVASSQSPDGALSQVVVVSSSGDIVQLRDAAVRYRPDGPVPQANGAEFSLFHALERKAVTSVVFDGASAEGTVWRVVLRDGRTMTVTGGEVRFEGKVVGANSFQLVGFLSGSLGPDAATTNPFASIGFISPAE